MFRLVRRANVSAYRRFHTGQPAKLPLADLLREAGCSEEDVAGWTKEMADWPEHSVGSFLEKIAQMNKKEPELIKALRSGTIGPTGVVEDEHDHDHVDAATLQEEYRNPATGEINGYKGAEPTRFGDWEHKGRATDF